MTPRNGKLKEAYRKWRGTARRASLPASWRPLVTVSAVTEGDNISVCRYKRLFEINRRDKQLLEKSAAGRLGAVAVACQQPRAVDPKQALRVRGHHRSEGGIGRFRASNHLFLRAFAC